MSLSEAFEDGDGDHSHAFSDENHGKLLMYLEKTLLCFIDRENNLSFAAVEKRNGCPWRTA